MIGGIVFVVFLILKLTGILQWSWWWITAPLWIGFIIEGAMMAYGSATLGTFLVFSRIRRASKRKVGGWVLFAAGISLIVVSIGMGIISLIDNLPASEMAFLIGIFAGPASVALWGGWKLAHPKPKPIYTDWSELEPPMERQPTADMAQQSRRKRTTNFCPNCGVRLSEELTYCPNRGKRLKKDVR